MQNVAGGGHSEGLFEAWSNLYWKFAVAMDSANRNDTEFLEEFWYPISALDLKASDGLKIV